MADALHTGDLLLYGLGVDALELLNGRCLGGELVHADDDAIILFDLALELEGALMDLVGLVAGLQGFDCPTLAIDLGDVVEGGLFEAVGEAFDVVRAGQGDRRCR